MAYGPLKKDLRQSPNNNNAVAGGKIVRKAVPPLVKGGAFGNRATSGKNQLGSQKYDRQAPAYPKQNNARPGSKVGHNAPSETIRDPGVGAPQSLMTLATSPRNAVSKNKVSPKNSGVLKKQVARITGLKG